MQHSLKKIVSSGFTYPERAALEATRDMHFLYGGLCPEGGLGKDGPISEKYALLKTPTNAYKQAVEWNLRDSDGTLVVDRNKSTKTVSFVKEFAEKYQKPVTVVEGITVDRELRRELETKEDAFQSGFTNTTSMF